MEDGSDTNNSTEELRIFSKFHQRMSRRFNQKRVKQFLILQNKSVKFLRDRENSVEVANW